MTRHTAYLIDVTGKLLQRSLDERLFGVRDLPEGLDAYNTFGLVTQTNQ